jgi:hypothetical protein
MNNLLTKEYILDNLDTTIKFLCYDIFITTDNQVFTLRFKKLKEQLIGGSYCFHCNGKYRTKTWIRNNCTNVLGLVTI